MTERAMRIWIGVFVLASLVLLGWLVIVFGSYPNFFKRTTPYVAHFADAQGIAPGSPVRRSGVRIGEVRDVILDDDTSEVKVVMAIDRRFTLRHSDEAMVVTGLLGGDASIDIVPKPAPEPGQEPLDRAPVLPGGEIAGKRQPTVNSVLTQASGVVPTAQETLNDIRKSFQRIEKAVPVFESTMKEYQDLATDLRKITPGLTQTSEELRELVKDARKAVPAVTRTADDVQTLANAIREAVPDARKTLQEVSALSQEARKAMPSLTKTSDEVGQLAGEARKTVSSFTRTGDELTALIQEVRGVAPELRKAPEKEPVPPKPPGKEGAAPKKPAEMEVSAKQPENQVPPAKAPEKGALPPVFPPDRMPQSLVQDARKSLDEIAAAARSWNKVGERVDVLIQSNQDKLVKALDTLNEALGRMSSTFSETNQNNLTEILRNVKTASTNFDSISRNVDVITTEGRHVGAPLNSTLERAESLIKEFQGATNSQGGRIGSITKNLDESAEKLNATLTDVRAIVRNVGQADGTVSRLLTDPSLYVKIDEAVCNFPRLTARIERILKDFEVFADKVARHPELIGVGGAVRPSTGVKDNGGPGGGHSTYYPPSSPPMK